MDPFSTTIPQTSSSTKESLSSLNMTRRPDSSADYSSSDDDFEDAEDFSETNVTSNMTNHPVQEYLPPSSTLTEPPRHNTDAPSLAATAVEAALVPMADGNPPQQNYHQKSYDPQEYNLSSYNQPTYGPEATAYDQSNHQFTTTGGKESRIFQ